MAIGSLVLGILSIVCCAAWYVSAVLALVGLVLGIIAKSKGNGGMATAGIVLSAIGLVFMIVIVVMLNVYQENILDWMTEFYNGLEEESYYTAIRGFFHR